MEQDSRDHDDPQQPTSKNSPSPFKLEEDFILVGYDVNSDPNPNPILKFLANQFPSLVGDLLSAFGIAPVVTLVMVYFLVKGVAVTAFNMSTLPLFKDGFNVTDGATYQRITTITGLAWPMKPVIGLLSDALPILAFRKRYYLTGAALTCVALLTAICLFKPSSSSDSPSGSNNNNNNNNSSDMNVLSTAVWFTAVFMFCTNLCFATMDLLCEAVYSRLYVLRPKAGTSIVSLVWGLVMISGVPGAFVVGPLADAHRPFAALFVIALLVALVVPAFYHNWLGEKPVGVAKNNAIGETSSSSNSSPYSKNSSSPNVLSRATRRIRNRLGFTKIRGESDNEGEDNIVDEENVAQNDRTFEDKHAVGDENVEMASKNNNNENFDDDEKEEEHTENSLGTTEIDQQQKANSSDPLTKTDEKNLRFQSIAMGIICPLTACSAMILEIWYSSEKNNSSSSSSALAFKKLIVPVCSACLLIYFGSKWLPRKIFKAMTYMMLKEASYASLSGALDFFYVADEHCVPGGPKFSYTYYQTTTTAVGSIFGAVGSVLFHKYFAQQNFQKIFWSTTCLRILASFFDIVLVQRWNIKYFGMSDEAAYMFGDAMVYPVTATLDFMPAVMLTAQLCPHGHEATMYAVLAGFANFGQGISGFLGAYLTDVFGIRTRRSAHHNLDPLAMNVSTLSPSSSVATCDFSNLSLLIFFAHGILPALTLPLVSKLVPKTTAQSCDDEVNVNNNTSELHRPTVVVSNQHQHVIE